jgi:glutamate 5-kinase
MQRQLITGAKRIVLKIGSSLVASRNLGLRHDFIAQLSQEIAALKSQQREIVIVSSGAIVAGIEKLGLKTYPQSIPLKQAAAAAGQSHLIHAYEKCFQGAGQKVAQVLLTHQDLSDRKRFLNARHTLTTLIELDVIPIINENDTVSVEEIRFGDNDTLAGQVAHLVDADLFVILSDVNGLYTEDPRQNPKAELLSVVEKITPQIEQSAGQSRGQESRGGMVTKIQAAKHVGQFGVSTLIMNGEPPHLLAQAFAGEDQGTLFLPQGRRMPSRKHWIAFTLRPKGQLVLDDGAVEALRHRGKSLLPSGILDIRGEFSSGDSVSCLDTNGKEFAKGLVNVSSQTLAMIKGRKTKEIQDILGGKEYEEVIHRDNLALL